MKIELRKITSVHPYPSNPRVNDGAVEAVATSIREFGFRQPIVVDAEGVIVVGHTRWKAAQRLGMEKVPVHVATDLTPEQILGYRIADNKTASLSAWDLDLLPLELSDLRELGFDLAMTGFTREEIDELLAPITPDGQTDEDEVPDAPESPISQPGRVYALGRHRLLLGDARNAEDVLVLMAGEKADLILTDPPYGLNYTGRTTDCLKIENDGAIGLLALLKTALGVAWECSHEGAAWYVAAPAGPQFHDFATVLRDLGVWRQTLVWVKNAMVLGRCDYHYQHEALIYGWTPGAAHRWLSDRKQTTVLEFDRPSRSASHPTMKPVALFERLIRNSSKAGQVVLDPFAGSGTTAIAAERSGRTARLVEIDPRYADVIRRRWAEFVNGPDCDWEALTKGEA